MQLGSPKADIAAPSPIEVGVSYRAFGLSIRSALPLPGMRPADATGGLPTLELTLVPSDETAARWQRACTTHEWSGRLGDGEHLVIERGEDGARMFSYGQRARMLLHADARRLECAPVDPSALDWQRVLITKVLPAISVMRGHEALHACAVLTGTGVVAIMGPSGAGKSTLASELLRRGLALFADDVVVLERTGDGPLAHPGSPHMNLDLEGPAGGDPSAFAETIAVLEEERWINARTVAEEPARVRMLCLLERSGGSRVTARVETANPVLLAPYMLGLTGGETHARERFELYADLTESATIVRLSAGPTHRPAELADRLQELLDGVPPLTARGTP